MLDGRNPLADMSTNVPSGEDSSLSRRLYPIFLGKRHPATRGSSDTTGAHSNESGFARSPKSSSSASHGLETRKDGSKRQRVYSEEDAPDSCRPSTIRSSTSIPDFFAPTRLVRPICSGKQPKAPAPALTSEPNVWRRPRRRLGQLSGLPRSGGRHGSFLSTLVTRIRPDPSLPPSTILLSSIQSPAGHDRDFDPALVVAFNDRAKLYTADEARQGGERRLLAIGGEEGVVRVIDVDQPASGEAGSDFWWRAHENGVFDLKWTHSDTRLLSASADQTLRLHDLSSESPKLLATLQGHTSTIKSVAFMDSSSNVVASGGRDGNINVYDLRCQGYQRSDEPVSRRRSSRTRSGPSTADEQHVSPVLVLRQPHNAVSSRRGHSDPRSVSRTITSLVALQSMPGVLASGGSFDGVVKLWDIRCPEATSSLRPKSSAYGSLPDPTVWGTNPSRRARSVNALCEQPGTGDLYALCGDSQIHVLRPSAVKQGSMVPEEAIVPQRFVHPDLLTRSFYIRMALSPDGNHLACGSSHAGIMMWDTRRSINSPSCVEASSLPIPTYGTHSPEVIAVDWAKDMLAASSDDCSTRIWHSNVKVSRQLREGVEGVVGEWSASTR